jgi:hypothetical protein
MVVILTNPDTISRVKQLGNKYRLSDPYLVSATTRMLLIPVMLCMHFIYFSMMYDMVNGIGLLRYG